EMKHPTVLRSANVDALHLVLGRDIALDQLGDLGADLGEIHADLGAQVLVDLDDLKLRLGDLALSLRRGADQLAAFALQSRSVAFELSQPGERDEVLTPQVANTGKLLLDQVDFLVLGGSLPCQAPDLFPELADALAELGLLSGPRCAPQLEQLPLAGDGAGDIGIGDAGDEILGKSDRIQILPLGLEAGLAGHKLVEILGDHRRHGADLGWIQPQQDIAGLDPVALLDAQLGDDAAGRVLDLLDVRIDDEKSGCDDGARELCGRRPAAHPAADQQHHHHAGGEVAADRALRGIVGLAHRAPAPSVTILSGMAAGEGGRSTLLSTSSLGPKAWQRPSPIISTWSTPARALGR